MNRLFWPIAGLIASGCTSPRIPMTVGDSHFEGRGLNFEEVKSLEETLHTLWTKKGPVKQEHQARHHQYARFQSLFGFEFSGPAIVEWIAKRVDKFYVGHPWTVAVYDGQNGLIFHKDFFRLSVVNRIGVLVHEAHHADGHGYRHTKCPKGTPLFDQPACDPTLEGAYSFQAAVLFELFARGFFEPSQTRQAYCGAWRRLPVAFPPARASCPLLRGDDSH